MNDAAHTLSPEWHNENALRAYPLADDCPAADALPSWFVTDLRVTVDEAYESVFVSSAYLSETLVSVALCGAAAGGHRAGLLVRTVTRDELEPGRAYSLESLDGTSAGTVVFGRVQDGAAPFKLSFSPEDAPLATNAVSRVKPAGVTRLVDSAHGTYATGIVDLSGNSEFRTYLGPSGEIVIELADMYRDLTTSVCSASPSFDHCGETPVSSVNGVTPVTEGDDAGTLYLRFR